MKTFLSISGSGLIGVITTSTGYGWFKPEGGFNIVGALLNTLAILTWVGLVHFIARSKDTDAPKP
jgi:hypothetical protein